MLRSMMLTADEEEEDEEEVYAPNDDVVEPHLANLPEDLDLPV